MQKSVNKIMNQTKKCAGKNNFVNINDYSVFGNIFMETELHFCIIKNKNLTYFSFKILKK